MSLQIATVGNDIRRRDAALLAALDSAEVRWICVEIGPLRMFVTADALKWGGVRYGVTAATQWHMAQRLNALLLTQPIADACALAAVQSGCLVYPQTQTPDDQMAYTHRYEQHSRALDAQIPGCNTGIVAGWKDFIRHPRDSRTRATNYGWHVVQPGPAPAKVHPSTVPGLGVVQPPGQAHSPDHADYSQLVRLVRRDAWLGNDRVDLAAVLRGEHGADAARLIGGPLEPTPPWVDGVVEVVSVPGSPTPPAPTSPGDKGPAVVAWQRFLLSQGYQLPRYGADGDHGAETQLATEAWLRDQRGDAGDLHAQIADFIEAKNYTWADRPMSAIQVLVLHSTQNPIRKGTARSVARWGGGPSAPRASWHYVLDRDETIQCVHLRHVAWAAPGMNAGGVQLELVGQAEATDWLRPGDDDRAGLEVTKRAARLSAALCEEIGLPVVRVDAEALLNGARGITTHDTVRRAGELARARGLRRPPWFVNGAWKRTDHRDPGLDGDRRWPWDAFLEMVRGG